MCLQMVTDSGMLYFAAGELRVVRETSYNRAKTHETRVNRFVPSHTLIRRRWSADRDRARVALGGWIVRQ